MFLMGQQHYHTIREMRKSTLKTARIIISSVILISLTLLFSVPSAWICAHLQGFQTIQWLPAAMSFSLTICIAWLVITLIFGRIYCSSICPLGTFQDICSHIGSRVRAKGVTNGWYHYHTPLSVLRNTVVIITFASLLLGITVIASFIDPASIFSRACSNILQPIISGTPPWLIGSIIGFVLALCMISIVAIMSWKRGRLWCNSFCPVGTTLGYVSRHSIMRIDIDTDRCTQCRKCEHVCKAECIDLTSHVVDGSRCVNCFNCIDICDDEAIHYTYTRKQLSIPMMQKINDTKAAATLNRQTSTSQCSRK